MTTGNARSSVGLCCCFGIHLVAVNFVVPPGQAEVGGDHVRARMDMADHALARRNRARERVLDGMTRFIFRDRWVRRGAVTRVAELRVRAGVSGIAVVGINHVAGRTTAGAVVSGMIVGAGQGKHRIEQARFLQAEKNRVGAQFRAEAAIAELVVGLARVAPRAWDCRFRPFCCRLVRTRAGGCQVAKFPSDRAA